MNVLVAIYSPFAAWNIPDEHVERLRRDFPQHTFLHAHSEDAVIPLVADADVAFTSELRPGQFAAAKRLRWIHSPAAGVGAMLFPELIDSAVVMSNSRGMSAEHIAEHVIGVTLALFRKLPLAFRSQAQKVWAQDVAVAPPPLRTINGSRALMVGLGTIGAACASRFAALGATVDAIRRRIAQPHPDNVRDIGTPDRLLQFLGRADIVVVTAAQTRETQGIIGQPELAAMKRDAILVNVSRGKLVDEAALARSLAADRIGGAALDVFEHEPLDPGSPLWTLPNVIVTPHMSGFRADHWDAATDLFAENLRRFDSQQPLLNLVDKAAGY
jgi:phosphoglycerate dehydrogenase-like enzyme